MFNNTIKMKKVLFFNSHEPQCGVWQYGVSLFSALMRHNRNYQFIYTEPKDRAAAEDHPVFGEAVAIITNWHPDMGGWVSECPFEHWRPRKQILVYHDWQPKTEAFDAVIFSDPTMEQHGNWWPIPRPLPQFDGLLYPQHLPNPHPPVIGCHGFYGADSIRVVEQVMKDFPEAVIRLHLPFAHYGDPDGTKAKEMAEKCREAVKDKPHYRLEISHSWYNRGFLMEWLAMNDMNVYMRNTEAEWKGVSSALDMAVAVGKPVAINRCNGFRHLFHCEPSICVEDRTLAQILESGTAPLNAFVEANHAKNLAHQVELVLNSLFLHSTTP